MTISPNNAAKAKSIVRTPRSRAINVAKAETPAEWELGIPPVSKKSRQSHRPVSSCLIGIFRNWASAIVASAVFSPLFITLSSFAYILTKGGHTIRKERR
ncbi:hypothetical protein DI43_05555 [Geobacillus sp. CAMR12739]|nr:hypothetical protein DI43_05555 [Geobacillus sp. CAMR12739]